MARAQCRAYVNSKSALEGCIRCAERRPRVSRRASSLVSLSVSPKTRPSSPPTSRPVPSPAQLPPAAWSRPGGCEIATVRSCISDRDASVPLQVVNETDLSLGLGCAIGRAIVACGHCLRPRIIISGQPTKNRMEEPREGEEKRGGMGERPFPAALLGARESLSNWRLILSCRKNRLKLSRWWDTPSSCG